MEQPKRVLCLMDLAAVGRAGLGTALCVLAACGVQGCGVPAMLYATHLGGFGQVAATGCEAFAAQALAQYRRENVGFDAIYTGYLTGPAQFALAHTAFDYWPEALKITDPVMADNGALYANTTPEAVAAMQALAARADIITPNLTEAALLLGLEAEAAPASRLALHQLAENRDVVLTSAEQNGTPCVMVQADGEDTSIFYTPASHGYPGTGDLFTAALCGLLLRGKALVPAAQAATSFVSGAVHATCAAGGEARHGVWYEPLLPELCALCGEATP